jgi:hypothetical protein
VPPDRKVTLPKGELPALVVLTIAVKVTGVLWATLLLLETTVVVVGAWITVIGTAAEMLGLKPLSPL